MSDVSIKDKRQIIEKFIDTVIINQYYQSLFSIQFAKEHKKIRQTLQIKLISVKISFIKKGFLAELITKYSPTYGKEYSLYHHLIFG